ncbi:MAG: hypothetical protein ACI9QV_000955 [Methylophagaceae bacterium]|jgi:hypothetical protein
MIMTLTTPTFRRLILLVKFWIISALEDQNIRPIKGRKFTEFLYDKQGFYEASSTTKTRFGDTVPFSDISPNPKKIFC